MRLSLLLTCLLLAAWTGPAGQFVQPAPDLNRSAAFSTVEKTTDGRAVEDDEAMVGPAETTEQLTRFDNAAVGAPAASQKKYLSEDALAALDAVNEGFDIAPKEAVPVPPRRVVPHAQVCEALADAAANNDLPTPFFIRLIWQESGFNQNVVSRAGAQGVAQFMPETAAQRGLADPFNPLQAVRASANLLRDLVMQFGNVGLAAAAYNAGPRRVQEWLAKRGKLPQETRDYVERITGRKADDWKARTAIANPIRVPARAPCQHEAGLYAANGPAQIPLPPNQRKSDPVTTASTKPASTRTVSAKSVSKTAKAGTAASKAIIKITKADSAATESKIVKDESKPPKVVAQNSGKPAGKAHGKKVKVADAEAHK